MKSDQKRFEQFVEFVTELQRFVPEKSRVMFCQVPGDPKAAAKYHWRAKALSRNQVREDMNVYACVSAMKRNERGEFRRRKDNFAGGLVLMIDDVGSGPGAKAPLSILGGLKPTALIETSPANFQAIYMFDRAVDDPDYYSRMIMGFIARKLLGEDTGMSGINRVFRPPYGINGKEKYMVDGHRFLVDLNGADYSLRYDPEYIIKKLRIPMSHRPKRQSEAGRVAAIPDYERLRRRELFGALMDEFVRSKSIRRKSDLAGWTDVICPWVGEHSDAPNTGAAIREPDPDNEWNGAFRCWHGSCSSGEDGRRGIGHVIQRLSNEDERFAAKLMKMEMKWAREDEDALSAANDRGWTFDGQ